VVAQSAIENAPYAFTLSGSDGSEDLLSTVGTFTVNSSGTITAGVADCNFNAEPFNQALSGSVLVGSGTAPGSASILTACSSTPLTFDVYAIDSTHLKFIESDGAAFLAGDAFAQTGASIPQGGLVFTMEGLAGGIDGAPFVAGGTVTSDGASQLSAGLEDVNVEVNGVGTVDGGVSPAVPQGFSGTFVASPSGSGRFQITLSGFSGGTNFAAYPYSGGILLLEIDSGVGAGVTSGMALAQASGAALAGAQGYGLNNSGLDIVNGVEIDETAQFTTTSTGMSGLLNENDGLTLSTENVNGTYAAGSNGAGSATIGTGLTNIFYYAADSSTVLFISTDPNQVAAGIIEAQTAPSDAAQSAVAKPRALPMLRALPRSRSRSATRHNQWFSGAK